MPSSEETGTEERAVSSSRSTTTSTSATNTSRLRTNYDWIDFDAMDLEWKHTDNTNRTNPRAVAMAAECRRRLTAATQQIVERIHAPKKKEDDEVEEEEVDEKDEEVEEDNDEKDDDGNDTTTKKNKTKQTKQTKKPSIGLILSGGVDTCAILDAAVSLGIVFDVAITCVIGMTSPDELYAKYAAYKYRHTGVIHHHVVVRLTHADLVAQYLPHTIQTLAVWDGMTIRNSLVISAAFDTAAQYGLTDVLVGDGADELFGGYTFTWGTPDMDPTVWKQKRDKMCQNWTFATPQLAAAYGITAHGPFMEPTLMVDWALQETQRHDCIRDQTAAIQLLLGQPYARSTTGKVLLREAFVTGSSWRRKDPIEVGSGATRIKNDTYWTTCPAPYTLSDADFHTAIQQLHTDDHVTIKTKENFINLRIYREIFHGLTHAERRRLPPGQGCIDCCFELQPQQMFCYMCGAYPAQRTVHVIE